ncbi:hypothetical protein SteCoe_35241 [Stentor coeruleus]|uniref:Uncharacterized protein n=1 Tax=Stentor coeruleus TaxID=5963 RepID=A0A1R2ASV5_9CILI|nr:hypothetical protein SteCoe_35241 [Stentor coeruleus]
MKLAFALLFAMTLAATPLSPVWPNVFWQPFNEKTVHPQAGVHYNTGTYYYNYNLPASRVDRSNGQYDSFCGIGGPYANKDTPCTHFVVGGNRYLYYPDLNQCCYCCNSTMGCGVLLPNWMQNATYINTEVHEGILTYKWEKTGGQQNYLYETVNNVPTSRVTVSIYEEPDNFMDFSHRNETLPNGIMNLPSICNLQNTCNWGFCQNLR